MNVLVNCSGITKRYSRGTQSVDVLTGIDLPIRDGDFIALMGPSGSGKTTLLNLLGGLDHPTATALHMDKGRLVDTTPRATSAPS